MTFPSIRQSGGPDGVGFRFNFLGSRAQEVNALAFGPAVSLNHLCTPWRRTGSPTREFRLTGVQGVCGHRAVAPPRPAVGPHCPRRLGRWTPPGAAPPAW
jgi:hypothetical protein